MLKPGESATVDGRRITYVRPTVAVDPQKLTFGALLAVKRGGEIFPMRPSRRFYRPTGGEEGSIASFFEGEATSEVALKAGAGSDLWIAPQPDIAAVQRRARAADRGFRACVGGAPGTPPQCRAVSRLMRAAAANPALRPIALRQIEALQAATAARIARLGSTAAVPGSRRRTISTRTAKTVCCPASSR